MNKIELAKLLNVSRHYLVILINQGLVLDEQIQQTKRSLERLEELKEKASSGKFNLK